MTAADLLTLPLANLSDVPAPLLQQLVIIAFAGAGFIAAAVSAINGIRRMMGHERPDLPQPVMIAMEEKFVPLGAHQALAGELRDMHNEVRKYEAEGRASVHRAHLHFEAEMKDIKSEMKSYNAGVHTRLDSLAETLAEMRGELKHIGKHHN